MELRGLSKHDSDGEVRGTKVVRCAYTSNTDKRTRAKNILQGLSRVVRSNVLTGFGIHSHVVRPVPTIACSHCLAG
jgi:hypothetical protein